MPLLGPCQPSLQTVPLSRQWRPCPDTAHGVGSSSARAPGGRVKPRVLTFYCCMITSGSTANTDVHMVQGTSQAYHSRSSPTVCYYGLFWNHSLLCSVGCASLQTTCKETRFILSLTKHTIVLIFGWLCSKVNRIITFLFLNQINFTPSDVTKLNIVSLRGVSSRWKI